MGTLGKKLQSKFEARRPTLPGRVTTVGLDAHGRQLGYVVCDVGGNQVKVNTAPGTNFQPGDWLTVEQSGGAASASYTAVGFTSGPRGGALLFEVPVEVQIGDETYEQGDLLLGDPLGKHWWFRLAQSAWLIRDGAITQGAIGNLNGLYDYDSVIYGSAFGRPSANWLGVDELNGIRMMRGGARLAQWREREILLGEDGQPQLRLGPTAIDFLAGDGSVQASLDGATRTIFGFDRWGRPLGPALEIGPTTDGRWGLWARGANNVPFAALLSGSDAQPDDVFFRLGAQGAGNYLEFAGGDLEISGAIRATSGVIGGWTIESDRLSGTGMIKLAGDAAGKRVIIDANQASYPFTVGSDNPASAPLKFGWFGDVWCSKINLLSGAANLNGWVIDIDNNNTTGGIGAIRGTGESIGVFGYANKYGVQGQALGATGAAGVYGFCNSSYPGVHGKGDPGVLAEATSGADALQLAGGPLNVNSQNITNVNRIYFDSSHYLYKSGDDIYWYDGSTGVKLN